MLFTEAIKNFLTASTYPDLAELYSREMEVQVLVAQDDGERVEVNKKGEKSNSYTDGLQQWYSLRIPRNANTDPIDNDHEALFDIAKHALGIGMTGWNFINRISKFVAYDFDAICGHSDKNANRLTELELREIENNVKKIPWVCVRYSTSGSGLHLYVFIDNVPTNNHTEHAGLSRAILSQMSQEVNYDFHNKVDSMGSVIWQWHRKMKGTRGLQLIKSHGCLCPVDKNWQDHIPVITNKKTKSKPFFIPNDTEEDAFLELCGTKPRIRLDEEHKKLLNYLNQNNHYVSYNQDHGIYITHTHALKEAFKDLKLKGIFDTVAEGKEGGDHNVWMSSISKGAWIVYRYSQNVKETANWEIDTNGYVKTYLNRIPELKIIARYFEAIEDPSGGYVFKDAKSAQTAASIMGVNLELPDWSMHKKTKLKLNKDQRLIAELDFDNSADILHGGLKGYLQKGNSWKRIFDSSESDKSELEISNLDDQVRHLVSLDGADCGWAIKGYNGVFQTEPINHVQKALLTLGFQSTEVTQVLGNCILRSWKLVNKPFQSTYPGDREWNKNSAQYKVIPSSDLDNLIHPTWDILFNHLGEGLNEALLLHPWAKSNNIINGAEYLRLWVASILKYPMEPLPYLFYFGPEDCGKSSFHESLNLLISNGIQRADNSLTSQGSFNAEIEHAVVCVIEETDLKKNKTALAKIRDFVNSRTITIHRKGETPYDSINVSHWLQCSNNPDACPVFPGDSRITVINVKSIPKDKLIPKRDLFRQLEKESSDFLAYLLNLEIPQCEDRLNIPVITTEAKLKAQDDNKTSLELFCDECCYFVPGAVIPFKDFYNRFLEYLSPDEVALWSKIRVSRELPNKFVTGKSTLYSNQNYVGNISWEPPTNGKDKLECTVKDGKIFIPK
jgi:Family of unknown function (DUF5906)